jgi:integrase
MDRASRGTVLAWLIRRGDVKSGWYVGFRGPDGREVRRAAGKSLRSAERIRAKIETQVREGKFFERDQRSDWSLGKLAETYLERMARLRPRSARWRGDIYRQVLRVLGPDVLIEEINMGTLDRYVNRRRAEKKAYSTINREISILRHSLRLAARWKMETKLTQFRLADWTTLRESDSARKAVFLTAEQVTAVIDAAHERASRGGLNERQGEAVIRLALETGARIGEILALEWEDLEGSVLRIRTEKHGPDRSIKLPESTVLLLWSFRKSRLSQGLMFPSDRTGYERDGIRRFWYAVRKAAKVEHIRFHDLRHTAASEMLRRGLLLREVQYVLGHASARMTERYAHFAPTFRPPRAIEWGTPVAGMRPESR